MATPQLIDLLRNTFTYIPEKRISAIGAVSSVAFDELRDSSTVLPDGSPLSELMWQFTNEELSMASPEVVANLQRRAISPSDEDIAKINVAKHNVAIPQFQPCPLGTLFKKASPEIIDLVQNTLKCVPDKRLSSICAVASTAFDELRDPSTLLPDGSPISLVMWQFTNEELSMATPEVAANLYPVPEDLSNSSSESQIADSLSELVKTISLSPHPHSADTTAENSLNSQMIQNGNNELQSTT